jgi:hypothetical protein
MGFRQDFGLIITRAVVVFAGLAIASPVRAQSTSQIVAELTAINAKVTNTPCNTGQGMLISNKAMNIFLSNKVSSYLSDGTDLSLYKNYVVLNAAEGSIAIDHNFHQPVDSDDWVRSFFVLGARVNIANAYSARFSNKYYDNRLGFLVQHTWMGTPRTYYNNCGSQKMAMDAQRAEIVHGLAIALRRKAADFEHGLDSIGQAEVPGQNLNGVKAKLRKDFYAGLRAEYLQKFSEQQSALLINTNNFDLVTDSWTTAGIYIPVITQKFMIAADVNSAVTRHLNYPAELSVTHTRFWESNKFGRLFFTLNGKVIINNSVQSGLLYHADAFGETSVAANALFLDKGNLFIGSYKNFVTPTASAKVAWLPLTSHFGLSFRIEKNFGDYHAWNAILGVPIVLIDKNEVPAITFEAQVLFSDMTNSLKNTSLPFNRTAIGFTVGIPFSKIVY